MKLKIEYSVRMSTTSDEKKRLAMFHEWPLEAGSEYYGLSSSQICAILDLQGAANFDRFDLEKRLNLLGKISLEWFALYEGVNTEDLKKRMLSGGGASFPLNDFKDETEDFYLIPFKYASSWVNEILPDRIWPSVDAKARRLSEVIEGNVRECAVSKFFKEAPTSVATCRCIFSWEDISIAHKEYVDNRKPFSLRPDALGWHELNKHPRLNINIMGNDLRRFHTYVENHSDSERLAVSLDG